MLVLKCNYAGLKVQIKFRIQIRVVKADFLKAVREAVA